MLGCTTGIVVFDDHRRWTPKFRGERARRLQIGKIVVGEFLALELLRGSQSPRCAPGWNIQRRRLMRIFAVAQLSLPQQRNV